MAVYTMTGPGPVTFSASNNIYRLPKAETITSETTQTGIILYGSDNLIKIAGGVKTNGAALAASGDNTVSITATGWVRSNSDGFGISMDAGHLVNDGAIRADKGGAAIQSGWAAFSLLNAGSIFGRVYLRGEAQEVVNHGEIKTRSSEAAVYMRESDSHLENSGRIVGGVGVEMRLRDDLVNSGRIEGRDGIAILADGTVENSGKIIGDVVFDPTLRSRPLGGDSRDGVFTALAGGWVKGAVIGADWDDTFTGNAHADRFRGGGGEDGLNGRGGNDSLSGGAGDDELRGGRGDDILKGGDGNDTLLGGTGDDILRAGRGTAGTGEQLEGGGGDDRLYGSSGVEKLFGGKGDDKLLGRGGNDVMRGGDGNDILRAGDQDTLIYGDAGRDRIFDGDGNSFLYGGSGGDLIKGSGGNDRLTGNEGNDRLFGGDGDDWVFGMAGNDLLDGGKGADTFFFLNAAIGRDRIENFEDGTDRIDLLAYDPLVRGFADAAAFADAAVTNRHGDAIVDLSVLTGVTGKIVIVGAAGQIDGSDFFLG